MSTTDIVVIVFALFIGYKFMSAMMAEPRETPAPAMPRTPGKRPWFEVLNVPSNASREQVVDAYRRLISEYHPDRVMNMGKDVRDLAERRSAEINVAYAEALDAMA